MPVEEIFKEVSKHMIEGLMFHEQLSEYYLFLGLDGYSKCHDYHYLCESKAFSKLNKMFISLFNKLLPAGQADDPKVIPSNWYKYKRVDVDTNTKRNGVKTGLEKWVEWEGITKKLYEKMYQELMKIDEVAAAAEMKKLVDDVTDELKHAEQYHLNKKAVDYDMTVIIEEQQCKKDKYDNKIREMFLYGE